MGRGASRQSSCGRSDPRVDRSRPVGCDAAARFLGSPTYRIRHDRAYWLSGITPCGEGFADTDLSSAGCGAPTSVATRALGAGPDPVPYVQDGQDVRTIRGPRRAQLTGTLAGVSSLVVDGPRACLPGAFSYRIESDGPAVLRLRDGRVLRLAGGSNTGTLPARR